MFALHVMTSCLC